MKINGNFQKINGEAPEFAFPTGRPRRLEKLDPYPWRWPRDRKVADEYVHDWKGMAEAAFGRLCISRATVREIASHISRKSGELRMTDAMLSSRTGRSIGSVKRDIRRLKDLGLIEARYEAGKKGRERVRIVTLSIPLAPKVVVSTPSLTLEGGGRLNAVPPVETLDCEGGARDGWLF